ncbi:MAG TPA: RNA polymerase sigma factor [Ktedonobacteraceae bacterium]
MSLDKIAGSEELVLMSRAARGDHEAFRCLVLSYEPKLLAYLTNILGDFETARDVAQETFVAVFHGLPDWQPSVQAAGNVLHDSEDDTFLLSAPASVHPLAPWLYRIATNRALSMLRKQMVRRRMHVSMPHEATSQEYPLWQAESIAQATPSIEDRYVAREMLREALRHLAEEDAACLVLHFVEGERYAEIAARLGISSEAVRKRVSRALVVLRQAYAALDMEVHL